MINHPPVITIFCSVVWLPFPVMGGLFSISGLQCVRVQEPPSHRCFNTGNHSILPSHEKTPFLIMFVGLNHHFMAKFPHFLIFSHALFSTRLLDSGTFHSQIFLMFHWPRRKEFQQMETWEVWRKHHRTKILQNFWPLFSGPQQLQWTVFLSGQVSRLTTTLKR